ncbi:MAG: DUF5630 domain-containing protein [Gammaproteobacteria bacterium]|nr:DUF5630 domain-containing protein [Gammaproteobacteria bacterium]
MEDIIKGKSPAQLQALHSEMVRADQGWLMRMSNQSQIFNQYCNQLDENNIVYVEWSRVLKEAGYYGMNFLSIDSGKTVTVFMQHIGSYLYHEASACEEKEKKALLFLAIEQSDYFSLRDMIKLLTKNIVDKSNEGESYEQEDTLLQAKCDQIAGLYGTTGYIEVLAACLDLGNFFSSTSELALESERFFKKAAAALFSGKSLYTHGHEIPLNLELLNTITRNKGLSAFNYTALEKNVSDAYNTRSKELDDIEVDAKKKVTEIISRFKKEANSTSVKMR